MAGRASAVRAPRADEMSRLTRGLEVLANPPRVEVGMTPCDVVYKEDRMRLLHYPATAATPLRPPLLITYAVINKPYILDLQPERSVIQTLQRSGVDVYMIDWGIPSSADQYLGIQDYVQGYMDRAVDRVRERAGVEDVSLMGYCIGGFLTTIYAALHPQKVRNLLLMAAPLDFGAEGSLLHLWTKGEYFDPDLVVEAFGNVPADFLNGGFVMLDPLGNTYLKYAGLMERADDEDFVEMFYRMEKWIADGVPVAGQFYKEFIRSGYQQNLLVQNRLVVGGERVDLGALRMPILVIVADKDHIVPPDSTKNLLKHVPSKDVDVLSMPVGHIGLSVGSESHRDLWPKVARWIEERSSGPPRRRRKASKR